VGVHFIAVNPLTSRILITFNPQTFELVLPTFWAGLCVVEGVAETAPLPAINSPRRLLTVVNVDQTPLTKPVLLSVLSAVVAPVAPISIGLMLSVAMSGSLPMLKTLGLIRPISQVAALAFSYLGFSALNNYLQHQSQAAWSRGANTIENNLRNKLTHHVHNLDMAYLDKQNSGELLNLMVDDTAKIRHFVENVPNSAIKKVLGLAAAGSVLLYLSPGTLLLALLPVPVFYMATRTIRGENSEHYRMLAIKNDEYCQSLMRNLSSVADIKSFNAEVREQQRLGFESEAYMSQANVAMQNSSYIRELTQLGVGLGVGASYTYGAVQVIRGRLSLDALIIQSALAPMIIQTTEGLDVEFNRYQQALGAANRIQALTSVQPQIQSGFIRRAKEVVSGEIVFDNVSFSYQPETSLLNNINIRIPAQSSVAFVGATGSGKSTLVKLILRLYDVDRGVIWVDGLDSRSMNIHDLRESIAVVSQDAYLNQKSIYDNIAYGRPDASRADVLQAAVSANAIDFINALPKGFDTIMGDKGQNFSGGERQRIAIARAVLKQASIFILDEATSSIDSHTESGLRRVLTDIEKQATIIIIAHKLISVRHVDQIVVLGHGRVLEHGCHDELMALRGYYEKLWRLQMLE